MLHAVPGTCKHSVTTVNTTRLFQESLKPTPPFLGRWLGVW